MHLLSKKLFRSTPLPPPSTCSATEPTHPTAAQGHNELAYKCWYAQLDAYSNAATVILAGERRRHSVDSRIAMRDALLAQTRALARSCGAGGRPAVVLRRPGRLAEGSSSWRSTATLSSSATTPHSRQARVISRQDLAPKWHFSVHLATWSRPEAPSFWE